MNKKIKSFYKLLNDYKEQKDTLTDEEKTKILKVLATVAKEQNIDLRKELSKTQEYQNPLDNKILLKSLIYQRYNNCAFNAAELIIPGTKEIKIKEKFNYYRLQQELINKITEIVIDKISNYATEDLNELYAETLIKSDLLNDKKVKKLLKSMTDYDSHIGSPENNIFKVPKVKQNYKIYINAPHDKELYYFLNEYIEKCILNGINYELIGYQINGLNKDHTILFASENDIKQKIKILDEIGINKSNIVSSFGSPLEIASQIKDSYYSITNIETEDYNEYFNNICEVAYYRVISKILKSRNNTEVDNKILDSIISLENVKINNNNLIDSIYNGITFNEIKDLVNRNIPDIMNTLKIYMEQEDKLDILIEEFKKSLTYLSNILEGVPKKENTNIAIRIKEDKNG